MEDRKRLPAVPGQAAARRAHDVRPGLRCLRPRIKNRPAETDRPGPGSENDLSRKRIRRKTLHRPALARHSSPDQCLE